MGFALSGGGNMTQVFRFALPNVYEDFTSDKLVLAFQRN
jgi:hypothetical protein